MKNSKEIAATVFKKRDEHLKNSMIKRRRMKKYAYIGSTACLCAIVVAGATNVLKSNNAKLPSVSESTISESPKSDTTVEETTDDRDIQMNTSNKYNYLELTSATTICDSTTGQQPSSDHTEKSSDGVSANVESELSTRTQTPTSIPDTSESTTEDETVRERRWDKKTLTQRFPEFSYKNTIYGLRDAIIENDYIGDSIGNVSLTGYDIYEDKAYLISANIYQIKDISNQAAVALRFENASSYYIYFNRNYVPNTLGTMIDDLNFDNTVVLDNMYLNGIIPTDNCPLDAVIDLLLNNKNVECEIDDEIHDTIVSFSVNIPMLGIKNKSIAITEDGYIITNIVENRCKFYIGEATVHDFCNSIEAYNHTETRSSNDIGEIEIAPE